MSELNFRHLDLNLLRVFDDIMSERSLTRAAQKLAITQPAVSNALRRLRDVLGDELLVRQGHGVEPTPRALALWPAVREALQQLETALAPDRFDPATANTTFVLAMADATSATLIAPLVQILDREAPGIGIRVLPLTTRDPRALLDAGEADMAAGYFPAVLADLTAREQSGDLVAFDHRRLYDGRYFCAMRHDHPLARETMTLDSYCAARHMLVSFSGRSFGFIDEALAALGRKRQVVLTVNQFFTAARVAMSSDLLTILPRHFVPITGMSEQLALRQLPFDVQAVHVDALWCRRGPHPEAYRWLLSALTRAAEAAFAADQPLHSSP